MSSMEFTPIISRASCDIGVQIAIHSPVKLSEAGLQKFSEACYRLFDDLYYDIQAQDEKYQDYIKSECSALLSLFPGDCRFKPVSNQYDGSPNHPWYKVFTTIGPIIIGWRKRVIVIYWEETIIPKNGPKQFELENVTRGDFYIHAWGYDKAREYIKLLFQFADELGYKRTAYKQ